MNVIDDDIPLLLGIEAIEKLKLTLQFKKQPGVAPRKRVANQIKCGTSNVKSIIG